MSRIVKWKKLLIGSDGIFYYLVRDKFVWVYIEKVELKVFCCIEFENFFWLKFFYKLKKFLNFIEINICFWFCEYMLIKLSIEFLMLKY